MPYIVSEQVAVTEYEKEPFHVEKKFEQTEWDKSFYTVTIDEPYVTELWEHYTAQIQIPYEVTTVRDLTVWEIEEYTVTQEVPLVVENPKIVVDIQQEAYTVPTKNEVVHEHAVLHDKNFGVGIIGSPDGLSTGRNGGLSSGLIDTKLQGRGGQRKW